MDSLLIPPLNQEAYSFDWSLPAAFFWGLLILIAFVGWGRTLELWLMPASEESHVSWGLAGALGMAAFLILSGPMLMLSQFSTTFMTCFLLVGWAAAGRDMVRQSKKEVRVHGDEDQDPFWRLLLKCCAAILCFFVVYGYVVAVANRKYDQYDDLAAYFYLTKKMLDLGTVYDPFSFRMLGALGGQITLSSLILGYLPWKYANLLDYGIAGLIVLGLSQEYARFPGFRARTIRLLLLLVVLLVSIPHTNTGSELTGAVLFAALFRVMDMAAVNRISGWKSAISIGGLGVAAATLRCHNVFVVGLLVGAWFVWQYFEYRQNRKAIVRDLLRTSIIGILFIVPWWVVSYRSGGTFLYPLFKGNHQPQFQIFEQDTSFWANLQFAFGFFLATPYLLLLLPVCLLRPGSRQRGLLVSGCVILFVSGAFLLNFNMGSIMYLHAYRYLGPIAYGFGLHVCGTLAEEFMEPSPEREAGLQVVRRRMVVLACCSLILLRAYSFSSTSVEELPSIIWATNAKNQIWFRWIGSTNSREAEEEYAKAFALIPEGAKTFIALDYPFLLDNRKHAIFSVDVAGAASLPPGLPYFKGSAAVKEYLLAKGFRYIAHVPFDRSEFLHSRSTASREVKIQGAYQQLVGWDKIEFMNNVDDLAKSNQVIYDSPTIRVIELRQ